MTGEMKRNPLVRIVGALLVILTAAAFAQDAPRPTMKRYYWDTRPGKCFMANEPVLAPMCTAPDDWPDWKTSVDRIGNLFIEPDRELILRAERELGDSNDTFASGEYRFDAWYQALYSAINYQPTRYAKFVDEWLRYEGVDSYAVIAQTLVRHGEAWTARGMGYGTTVSKLGWKIYFEKLEEADRTLESASERMKRTGPWYALKLQIALERNDSKTWPGEIFEAGTDAWPLYPRLYLTVVGLSLPRWGGDFEKVDLVARYAMAKTLSRHGAAMYAIVYARTLASDAEYTMRDSKADWKLVKQGFHDAEKGPERGRRLLGQFATLSCQMEDREEAKRIFALIDDLSSERALDGGKLDTCRLFAMQ
jgi:hypothetical protein